MTVGNSSPLALCRVIIQIARVSRALLFVDVRQQRQPIDEPDERRLRLTRLVFARRRHELREILDAGLGILAARRADPAGTRSGRASSRWRPTRVPGARWSVSADDKVTKHRERRRGTAGEGALLEAPRPRAPRANWPTGVGCSPAASRGSASRSASGAGATLLERLHHALADASRRDVDDAPQADVVVRIDDEPHVRQRVLDFLALVETNAADDLVREPLAHQRVFYRPRLRVGPVEHGDGRIHVLCQRPRGPSA